MAGRGGAGSVIMKSISPDREGEAGLPRGFGRDRGFGTARVKLCEGNRTVAMLSLASASPCEGMLERALRLNFESLDLSVAFVSETALFGSRGGSGGEFASRFPGSLVWSA
jgi:hypothetical protein